MTINGNNDIISLFVSYVDGTGGKSRPVLVVSYKNNDVQTYRLTTKFSEKSDFIKEQYYELKYWERAGLKQKSWVDLGDLYEFQLDKIRYKKIGEISIKDFVQLRKQLKRVADKRAILKFKNLLSKRVARVLEEYLESNEIPSKLVAFGNLLSAIVDEQVDLGKGELANLIYTRGELSNDKINSIIKEFISENYDNDYLIYKIGEKIDTDSLKNELVDALVHQLSVAPRYRSVERSYWRHKLETVKSIKELFKYAQNEDLEGLTDRYVPEWEEMTKRGQ